jgi:hypothetical protein
MPSALETRCVVCGAWCMVRMVHVVHGAWCKVHGAWCVVHGARCMVKGEWCEGGMKKGREEGQRSLKREGRARDTDLAK